MGDRTKEPKDTLAKPAAQRLQRPSWRDSRLVIGILLIALATIGGAAFVNTLDDSVEVYRARTNLLPGQPLRAEDLSTIRVRMSEVDRRYLTTDRRLPSGRILREVRAGELLPASSVGAPGQVGVKAVSIEIDPSLAATLVSGSIVDVWVSAKQSGSAAGSDYAAPVRMVQRATISRVPAPDDTQLGIGGGQRTAVHVLVPDAQVNGVINAVDTEAKITLVAAPDSPMRPVS